jgi:hypothetical protein
MELGLGLSFGCARRTIWIADAHRDDGKRFVVRADKKLIAFFGTGSGEFGLAAVLF